MNLILLFLLLVLVPGCRHFVPENERELKPFESHEILTGARVVYPGEDIVLTVTASSESEHNFHWEDRDCSFLGLHCGWSLNHFISDAGKPSVLLNATPELVSSSVVWELSSAKPGPSRPNTTATFQMLSEAKTKEALEEAFISGLVVRFPTKETTGNVIGQQECTGSSCSFRGYTFHIDEIRFCNRLIMLKTFLAERRSLADIQSPGLIDPLLTVFLNDNTIDAACHKDDRREYVANLLRTQAETYHPDNGSAYYALMKKAHSLRKENIDLPQKFRE